MSVGLLAHDAAAISSPSSDRSPTASYAAISRSTAQPRLTAVGRETRRALAPPRIVARRAYGRESANLAAVSARPIAATWPIAGAPRTIISRMAKADLAGGPAVVLDEGVGQVALVDEVQDAVVLAERRPEPGRARVRRPVRPGASASGLPPAGSRMRAGGLGRRALQGLGGAGHRGAPSG